MTIEFSVDLLIGSYHPDPRRIGLGGLGKRVRLGPARVPRRIERDFFSLIIVRIRLPYGQLLGNSYSFITTKLLAVNRCVPGQ